MGYLTTHILDMARGVPAGNVRIELVKITGDTRTTLNTLTTNSDGRTDTPILGEDDFETGRYELVFHAGDYLRAHGVDADPLFLDIIPIRFGINDATAHYHVPLLLSPYGYSTYRGS